MSELSDTYGHIDLTAVREMLHLELDAALDELLLDILHKPPATDPERIVIVVAPALLQHAQALLP